MPVETFLNGTSYTLMCNTPGHGGGFIALVEDGDNTDGFRRLALEADRDVSVLQIACDCGWRSSRFTAPPGTRWLRGGVAILPDYVRGATAMLDRLWRWHLQAPMSTQADDN